MIPKLFISILPKVFLKKVIDYVADQCGLLVFSKARFGNILIATRLSKIISEYKIDCILDVGANVGQYYYFLRNEVGYKGLIISFEPDPKNINMLKEKQKLDANWLIQDYALGKENSPLTLNLMKSSVFNSFLKPDSNETKEFKDHNLIQEKVTVEVKRLDEVIYEFKKARQFNNVFLKMDTQGFDLNVFEGATNCLNMIRGVQTEISVTPIYKHMPTFDDSLRAFKSKGFEVSGIYSLGENRFPHAIEFDCIYLPKSN